MTLPQDEFTLMRASNENKLAKLKADAERIFPDDYTPTRKAGLGSIGLYSVRELREAHIAMNWRRVS